jgi:hypothetical protein
MKELIKKILEKWARKHEWKYLDGISRGGFNSDLYVCTKCGKFKNNQY